MEFLQVNIQYGRFYMDILLKSIQSTLQRLSYLDKLNNIAVIQHYLLYYDYHPPHHYLELVRHCGTLFLDHWQLVSLFPPLLWFLWHLLYLLPFPSPASCLGLYFFFLCQLSLCFGYDCGNDFYYET